MVMRRVPAIQRRQESSPDDRDAIISQCVLVDRNSHGTRASEKDLSMTTSEFALSDALSLCLSSDEMSVAFLMVFVCELSHPIRGGNKEPHSN